LALLGMGRGGVQLIVVSLIAFAGLRWLMIKRLGGTTGDTAGAMVEIVEVAALLGLLMSLS